MISYISEKVILEKFDRAKFDQEFEQTSQKIRQAQADMAIRRAEYDKSQKEIQEAEKIFREKIDSFLKSPGFKVAKVASIAASVGVAAIGAWAIYKGIAKLIKEKIWKCYTPGKVFDSAEERLECRISGLQEVVKEIQDGIRLCSKTKDPSKCKQTMSKQLEFYKTKLERYKKSTVVKFGRS